MTQAEKKQIFLFRLFDRVVTVVSKQAERFPWARNAMALIGLGAAYFVAGRLGLALAPAGPGVAALWPSAGLALAAFLSLGYRVWPGIFAGALLVHLSVTGSLLVSSGVAAGNTLEALAGCYLLNRLGEGRRTFESFKGVLKFVLLVSIATTTIGATIAVTGLTVGGFLRWADSGTVWLTWWLASAVGNLMIAPLEIFTRVRFQFHWNRERFLEVISLLFYLSLAGLITFEGLIASAAKAYPLEFLCVPALIWAGFRFPPKRAQLAICLLGAMVIHGALHGYGPFVRPGRSESLFLAQTYTTVMAVMTLLLATVAGERARTTEQIRQIAVTDPMTGLANYRKLLEVLDAEIKRADRTGRPFALLLLDLDGLKQINDGLGHLAGSRALCRLGKVLRARCRATDTPARYGGDEFAVVLPEAGADAADLVARRIRCCLAADVEDPRLSVSSGAAVFPADGKAVDELLRSADAALYRMKLERDRPERRAIAAAGE